jgi:hypothetical protein
VADANPACYYSYAMAQALLFQLHHHIAREILKQDPHDTDYSGHREGCEGDRRLLRSVARWLEQQDQGRKVTLPEL